MLRQATAIALNSAMINFNMTAYKAHTLNALTEGYDIAHCKDEARAFLTLLMHQTPHNTLKIVLPVARRLFSYDGWQTHLNIRTLIDFCTPRRIFVELLDVLRTDDLDPASDYLIGLVACLHEMMWPTE